MVEAVGREVLGTGDPISRSYGDQIPGEVLIILPERRSRFFSGIVDNSAVPVERQANLWCSQLCWCDNSDRPCAPMEHLHGESLKKKDEDKGHGHRRLPTPPARARGQRPRGRRTGAVGGRLRRAAWLR